MPQATQRVGSIQPQHPLLPALRFRWLSGGRRLGLAFLYGLDHHAESFPVQFHVALSHNLVGLRDTFLGACGTEIAAQLGFALRTPQQPGELFEQAQHLVARLGDPELVLPEPRYKGILLDAAEMTAELQPLVDKLGETLEDLSREARLDESTKIAKDEMLHAYDRTFLWAARTAESLFRLVNLPEVAKRVRPSTRRPGLTDEVETQGPDTGPGDPQPGGAVASPDASTDDATENP